MSLGRSKPNGRGKASYHTLFAAQLAIRFSIKPEKDPALSAKALLELCVMRGSVRDPPPLKWFSLMLCDTYRPSNNIAVIQCQIGVGSCPPTTRIQSLYLNRSAVIVGSHKTTLKRGRPEYPQMPPQTGRFLFHLTVSPFTMSRTRLWCA